MPEETTTDNAGGLSIPTWLAVALFFAWMLPGLFGHEPWKPDEGYTVGLVRHAVTTGDWVVPTLTGEPFMEKPPIFFITAAVFATLFSPWLMPMHQAAALASVLFSGLTLIFVHLAAKEAGGRRAGMAAMLGLLGCIGFIVRSHSLITDTALWSGFAIACYGILLAGRRNLAGAFWFGTGAGLAFMAKGFLGPAFIGTAAFLLPLFCPDRRNIQFVKMLAWSFVFSLPWLVIWPTLLYLRSPQLFSDWFWLNNVGRFLGPSFGFPALAQARGRWGYLTRFLWFTLPLWPPVLALLGRRGLAARRDAAVAYPVLVVAVGMALLIMAAGQRELYMIPLLIPLAILAGIGLERLPGWADRLLRRLPLAAASAGLLVIWAAWAGWRFRFPHQLTERLDAFAPGLSEGTGALALAAAVLYTAGWVWLFLIKPGNRKHWALTWAGCLTAVWGTGMLLFMPILDYTNGYRATFAAMAEHLPADTGTRLDAFRFGESQRAIFEYYFGRRARILHTAADLPDPDTDYLIAQNHRRHERYDPGEGWEILWQGTRPGDRKEWYVLYRRVREAPETDETPDSE